MATIDFQGKQIRVTEDSHLIDPADWSSKLAERLAMNEGITLNYEHWWFLYFVRKYYLQNGFQPLLKYLIKSANKELGDGKGHPNHIEELFPSGYNMICKLAGIPKLT